MISHSLILTAVIVWLALWAEHWFPWNLFIRRELPRIAAYVLGVLAMIIPLSVYLLRSNDLQALVALWVMVVTGGASVVTAYGIDLLGKWISGLCEDVERLEMINGRKDRS